MTRFLRRRRDPEFEAAKTCISLSRKVKVDDPDTLKACRAVLEDVASGKDDVFDAAIKLHNIFRIPPYKAFKIVKNVADRSG